jgi:hypothetical protein
MVNSYVLVNPYIDGSFKSEVKARNSQEAAKMLYTSLSEHFNNSIPSFHFTIQKGKSNSGKLYHFKVNESREGNTVDFTIKQHNVVDEDRSNKDFRGRLDQFKNKLKQGGGKHDKDHKDDSSDSSDSSSSSDYYRRAKQYTPTVPFSYYWYDPFVYRLDSVFIPSFYSYNIPMYLEIRTTP